MILRKGPILIYKTKLMGRYSSYGIATLYAIPLRDLSNEIKRVLWGKSIEDFNPEDLRTLYPEDVYDIQTNEEEILISLKDKYNGSDIFSLIKDFATVSPNKNQLSSDILEAIHELIRDKTIKQVVELAEKKMYEGFQELDLPYYLYWTPIPVGNKVVYTRTMVKGIMIGFHYAKVDTEDATEPYSFLTSLLRYRLRNNPLSPTLLAYLSV